MYFIYVISIFDYINALYKLLPSEARYVGFYNKQIQIMSEKLNVSRLFLHNKTYNDSLV